MYPSGIVSTYSPSSFIKTLKRFDVFDYSIVGSHTAMRHNLSKEMNKIS
jgi:hypothetical protein